MTETHVEAAKGAFDFRKWISGSSRKEYIENVSYLIIVASAVMVSAGVGLGSFISGSVFMAVLGAFFVMIGVVVYIASQFIGE
ncbi:MAG: hypothetical protein V1678_02340 [Candidatus Aenigmatarchaeota archaeon]